MNLKKPFLWRVWTTFFVVAILAIAVLVQIVRLQTVKKPVYAKMADSLSTRFISIDPMRGNIYACDGSLLATSIPIYDIHVDLKVDGLRDELFDKNIDSLAFRLSNYFKDKSTKSWKEELMDARKAGSRYHLIHRKVNHRQLKEIKQFPLFREGRYKGGLIVEQTSKRIMPFGMRGQRTIGYARENIKPVGLEGALDSYLSGTKGKRLMQKVSGNVWIPINDRNELEPQDGQDVITTIDVNFQDITHTALLRTLQANGADHGCAVVMEVATGHIKAISNLAQNEKGEYYEMYNWAVGETIEPGSTFKLASVMALLDETEWTPKTTVDIEGGETRFYDRIMRDSEKGHGTVTLQQGFELSSNVAISKAVNQAFGKEPQKYVDYLKGLGLAQPLGLPISGEGHPLIKDPSHQDWSGISLPWMSIGYEVKLTPLQILTLYNAVANDGVMVKPQFVTEIREVGKPVTRMETEIINNRICSEKTLKQVRAMMEGVVERGTAKSIKTDLYKIAGKTGTALVANKYISYRKKVYQASFAGYFPADAPKYSIIVTVTHPREGVYYGSALAAPVFREISDRIYALTNTSKETPAPRMAQAVPFQPLMKAEHFTTLASIEQVRYTQPHTAGWVSISSQPGRSNHKAHQPSEGKVPDARGLVLGDALYLLENAGLKVRFSGSGRVKLQSIEPGTPVTGRPTILIELE